MAWLKWQRSVMVYTHSGRSVPLNPACEGNVNCVGFGQLFVVGLPARVAPRPVQKEQGRPIAAGEHLHRTSGYF